MGVFGIMFSYDFKDDREDQVLLLSLACLSYDCGVLLLSNCCSRPSRSFKVLSGVAYLLSY